MRKFFFLAILSSVLPFLGQDFPRAQWLHYPEPDAKGLNVPRYFWTHITIKEGLQHADIYYLLDDDGDLILDGTQINRNQTDRVPNAYRIPAWHYDATQLAPGPHLLELKNINGSRSGGILCRIALRYADGTLEEIFSDTTWATAKAPAREGGLAEITAPLSHGDLTVLPFGAKFVLDSLYCEAEQKALQEKKAQNDARFQQYVTDVLDKETHPIAKVIYKQGQPMFDIGGTLFPPMFYSVHHYQDYDYDKFVDSMSNFRDANIHLYVMGISLKQLWRGPKNYDFSLLDTWAPATFLHDPEARLVFEIACTRLPEWWMEAHPEECVVYLNPEGSDITTEQIVGHHTAPSFASELYKSELADFLKALVTHVESQPWGKRVFAYRNDNGVYLEWHHWGMNGYAPDVSAPMQRHFTEFLKERYGTDQALQKAWGREDVTLDSAKLADFAQRTSTSAGNYSDAVKDAQTIDSVRCVIDAIGDFLLQMNHVIKEACGRRCLVGNYYGYFFGVIYPACGWQLQLERMLNSPDVDFNCQPPPYGPAFRDFGQAQFSRGLTSSYRLHGKLNIMEADTRTHAVPYGTNHCFCETPEDTINLMARDFCQALCGGIGFWYFDFGEGWYTHPLVRDYLQKLRAIWETPVDKNSAAEVVLIGDHDSVYYQAPDIKEPPALAYINQNRATLSHTGVVFDAISLCDVENPNLKDYKVYIFFNALESTPERIAMAQRLRDRGKTIVWLDKAGFMDAKEGFSIASAGQLTAFDLKAFPTGAPMEFRDARGERHGMARGPALAPMISMEGDTQVEPLGWNGKHVVFGRKANEKGGWSYLATVPALTVEDYKEIFRTAGVHCYCEDESAAIYANKSFLTLHVDKAGTRLLILPRPCRLIQLLPEEKILAEETIEYAVDADPHTTYLFRME